MTDDCGQSGPCAAKAPGCARHFMERIAELRAEVEHWKCAAKEHAEAQAAAESEIERMQIKEKTLTAERDHFKAMLRERAARHLEAEEALEKQSLEFRAIAKAIDAAREACDREAESHPSSRSSAPLVRYVAAMDRLRKWLMEETEAVSALGIEPEREL